jgi:hypothetical protein
LIAHTGTITPTVRSQTGTGLCLQLLEGQALLVRFSSSLLHVVWRELECAVWEEVRQLGESVCVCACARVCTCV